MKKYNIEIRETLSRIIPVEAESPEMALAIAESRYYDEEEVLDHNDFVQAEFFEEPLETYTVRIEERLAKTFPFPARSEEEALSKARAAYESGEISVDKDLDYCDSDYQIV